MYIIYMNKYEVASQVADRLIEDSMGQFELILRQLLKQAFIEGTKYGENNKDKDRDKDVSKV